jgi:hypothetical protein
VRTLALAHPDVPEAALATALEASGGDLSAAAHLLAEHAQAGGGGGAWQQQQQRRPRPAHRVAAASPSPADHPYPAAAREPYPRPRRSSNGGAVAAAVQAGFRRPSSARSSSSSAASSLGGGDGGGGGGGGPPSPTRGGRGPTWYRAPEDPAAASAKAEVDRLYNEAKMKELEAVVLERAVQEARTKADADRLAADRRAAQDRAAALRRDARRLAADAHNAGKVNHLEVDVHGQSAGDALARVRAMLESARAVADASRAESRLTVVVGRGLHSGAAGPVLRPAVLDFLARGQYAYEVPAHNPGVVIVTVCPSESGA